MPDPHNPEQILQDENPMWLKLYQQIAIIHYKALGVDVEPGFDPGEVLRIVIPGETLPLPVLTAEEFRVAGATVEGRNAYQNSKLVHPYTCGKQDQAHLDAAAANGDFAVGILVATENNGWRCPVCGYTQTGAKYRLQP